MPTPADVHEQLTDILVRLVGCDAEAVVPEAVLTELGTDSLTIVEVAEELGRRFEVYLSDDTVDALVTVADAIGSVVHHDGAVDPAGDRNVTTVFEHPAPPVRSEREEQDRRRRGAAATMAFWFVAVGAVVGIVLGMAGSALVEATGISSVDLPPISAPSPSPTIEPTEATTPTPEPTETETPDRDVPDPTLRVSKRQAAPGERFILEGRFPAVGEGATLQVQVKDEGGDWDDFPIATTTRERGRFKTEIYTSRGGERQFRLLDKDSDEATPAVTVQIG